jgi:hydrogenase/urease accessory protein HupE
MTRPPLPTVCCRACLLATLLMMLAGLAFPPSVRAHESRPAVLHVRMADAHTLEVAWIAPHDTLPPIELPDGEGGRSVLLGRGARPLLPVLPDGCVPQAPPRIEIRTADRRWTWTALCPTPLDEITLGMEGLRASQVDGLVRFDDGSGVLQASTVVADAPRITFTLSQARAWSQRWGLFGAYLLLGIDHILLGPDHLLFVLLLLLVVPSVGRLVGVITGFTLGHSVTLAMAVLGWVHVPGPPVESLIALSIVLLAHEAATDRPDPSLQRRPWVVSSLFGLLHGLGFAGALAETGLPTDNLPLGLLAFNLGVEVGQLAFVAVLWLGLQVLTPVRWRPFARMTLAWSAGLVGGFWVAERVWGIVAG